MLGSINRIVSNTRGQSIASTDMQKVMKNIVEELSSYVNNNNRLAELTRVEGFETKVRSFLDSRMDEIRLLKANELCKEILSATDLDDLEIFRDVVRKREGGRAITYPGQRDHSAHTLYNWLLGWYFFDKSNVIQEQFESHLVKRGWKLETFGNARFFSDVWHFVSILHDVGYIFEGSLPSFEMDTVSKHVNYGIKTSKDYFESRFWIECGFSSMHQRNSLKDGLKIREPEFEYEMSVTQLADTLANLGDLSALTDFVLKTAKAGNQDYEKFSNALGKRIPGDAFDIWAKHYSSFEFHSMSERIPQLRKAFENLMFKGMPGSGVRILDHGVAGGLLLLQISTFYHNILAIASQTNPTDSEHKNAIEKFKNRMADGVAEYDPHYWWIGIVWATAAVAFHNLLQKPGHWPTAGKHRKLALQEDPLTYLGILVDLIQEFDRYSVYPSEDKPPLQSSDVYLAVADGKIQFKTTSDRIEKIKKDLDQALEGWSQIMVLTSIES